MKAAVNQYNDKNAPEFVIATNNKKSLLVKCNHGIARKSKSIGKRPEQHYNFIGCGASVTCYKSQKNTVGEVKVTKVNLTHNHKINQAAVHDASSLSQEEESLVTTLRSANAQTSQIKRALSEKFQKNFTTQKLRNMMNKLKTTASSNYETFFEKIEDEGGKMEYELSGDGEINTLFIASKTMVNAFTSTDPPLMQIDTPFDVDKARYKIAVFCYLNLTTNKTEIAAIAYTADETADSLGFIFKHFNYLCINRDKMFIVDKDFTQLSSIEKYFPGCTILLCQFHTLKFMRTLLATALETVENKNELYAMLNE